MRKISIKLTTVTLLAALLCQLASCSGKSSETEKSAGADSSDSVTEAAETEAETQLSSSVEAVDMGGADFTFLTREKTENYNAYPYPEVLVTEQNGETLNDAVFARNLAIEEKYDLSIKTVTADTASLVDKAKKAILAGDAAYDVIFASIAGSFSLGGENLVYDLADVPHLDFSRPWWMAGIRESTSIGGHNMFMSGDLNLAAMNTVGVTFCSSR